MKQLAAFDRVYFVGIGGIGMSALARFFKFTGKQVAGYDKVETVLTQQLAEEGMAIHYEDLANEIPSDYRSPENTLVVYTPAIKALGELTFFQEKGFQIMKRAEVLGALTQTYKGLCVAGTHGKTTTSSLLTHLLTEIEVGCTSFLGGIASNFESNLVLHAESPYAVIEADEFDRSFLQLSPFAAIVTAADADHLDIYGSEDAFVEGFRQFTMRVDPKGFCIQKEGLQLQSLAPIYTYAIDSQTADYSFLNLRYANGFQVADLKIGAQLYKGFELGLPGIHNAENALGCIALLDCLGFDVALLRPALKSFKGVKRRFEYHLRSTDLTYIDDYAHHPTEIDAFLKSLKSMYPRRKLTVIFQPHLFTRTRDFAEGFSKSLSLADEVLLMDIYPARELPIPGVTSDMLFKNITSPVKIRCDKKDMLSKLEDLNIEVLATVGAGD
ncbi:MAG: UDP-N-acetylmuramate--L-alanine ligase, partial [Flavobacteriia bacterium]